jgi:PAS domain S-box-containing protein
MNTSYLTALYDLLDFHAELKGTDEEKVWSRVTEKLAAALDVPAATYYAYLPAKRHLMPRHAVGPAASDVTACAMDLRTGICGWVARHREPALVEDARKDDRFFSDVDSLTGFKTVSVLAVPLLDRLDLVGVLQFLNKSGGPFNEADLRFVTAACKATAVALRALRLEGTVDRISAHNASILQNLSGGFIAIDTNGRVIICNPAARAILRIPVEVVPGVPADRALASIPRLVEILTETLASRQPVKRQEFSWNCDGKDRILGYSTLIIQDPQGNFAGAGITFQDITDLATKK